MNQFIGLYGGESPSRSLNSIGIRPLWQNEFVAFAGAPIYDTISAPVVLSGEYVLGENERRTTLAALNLPPDSENLAILATLYCRYGLQLGRHAPGMFAVALWEKEQKRLILLRDRVGARTLYFAHDNQAHTTWFAAQLRNLRRTPAVSDALSIPALRDYLACAFVAGSQTLWRDASELRPAQMLQLPAGTTEIYDSPTETELQPAEPMEAHATRLRKLLETVVQGTLPIDAPVGVFLSGGLDSSLVTALAARFSSQPVHTFAIHFGKDYPNELPFSSLVAEHCKTVHHIIELSARQVKRDLAASIAALDDPIGDPLTTPNLILGRFAAREVGVILNGEGGDPCFGGPKNLPMLLHELYSDDTEAERSAAYLRSYQKCYDDLPRLLNPDALAILQAEPPIEEMLHPYFGADSPMRQYLNQLMLINVRLKGADHILTKVNNLTTANKLLGFSPLFDPRIVEMSFAIPPAYKLSGSEEKAALKMAVADLLPSAILTRPKSGMLVPVQRWFQHDLRGWAKSLLLSHRSRLRPYIREDILHEWLNYKGHGFRRQGVKLWLLLTLEIWLRENP